MNNDIQSQSFGFQRILGEGWRLYRAHVRDILAVALCVYVPQEILGALAPESASAHLAGTGPIFLPLWRA